MTNVWASFQMYIAVGISLIKCVFKTIEHLVGVRCLMAEKAMAPHSSTLAWKIPWTEEPGRLQSMGSLGDGHD